MPSSSARNSIDCERRVSVLYVKKGMFINRLDRPWIDTPFWLQGFFVRTEEELHALQKYCNSVYIDISRGIKAEYYMEEDLELPTSSYLEKEILKKKQRVQYKNKLSLKDEIENAQQFLEQATERFQHVIDDLKYGRQSWVTHVSYIVQPMLESVMRNSDALLLLTRLRNKNNHSYYHGIDACVMALTFGRFMGMPVDELNRLAIGALLLDIGKINVSEVILNKTESLTDLEYGEACSHVEHGVKYLRQGEGLHEDIINMVLAHHERSDGSGYPNGLIEHRIPAFARIAGIIDCYNAMCGLRPYHQSLTPFASMQELYNLRKQHFQSELVEKFMQCIGVYPNGSLLEFKSGEVAIVLAQNLANHSKPKIMLLLDALKRPYVDFKVIDMSKRPIGDNGKPMVIHRDLKQNDFNIDLSIIYNKLKIALNKADRSELESYNAATSRLVYLFGNLWVRILNGFRKG